MAEKQEYTVPAEDRDVSSPDNSIKAEDSVKPSQSTESMKAEEEGATNKDIESATAAPVAKGPSANNIAAIPNGGLQAWMQVVGAWVLFFNTWGLLNTFGVYQEYYESGQLFVASSSNISWIGSIQSFLLLFIGAITGPIFDAGHLRYLLVGGSFLIVFGHMMLSLVHTYWEALLAQAFVIGLGAGCLFVPSVAILAQYFSTRISTAIGLSVSGSSLGGVIYPIMLNRLVQEVGFSWAVRIIGFMALVMLIVPCAVMKMRVKPPGKRALIDLTAFQSLPYPTFVVSGFFGYMGLLTPFFYISLFAESSGYASKDLSFYVLPIVNAFSIFGRVVPSIIADKLGPLNMLAPAAAVTSILIFILLSVHNLAGVIIFAAFYGFWSGTYISLPPSILVSLTPPDKRYLIGTRMGMAFTIMGLGILTGPPVAGAILTMYNSFNDVWIWSGVCMLMSFVGFTILRIELKGFDLMQKI